MFAMSPPRMQPPKSRAGRAGPARVFGVAGQGLTRPPRTRVEGSASCAATRIGVTRIGVTRIGMTRIGVTRIGWEMGDARCAVTPHRSTRSVTRIG